MKRNILINFSFSSGKCPSRPMSEGAMIQVTDNDNSTGFKNKAKEQDFENRISRRIKTV